MIDRILSQLIDSVVMSIRFTMQAPSIVDGRIMGGNIEPDPMAGLEDIAGRPDFAGDLG